MVTEDNQELARRYLNFVVSQVNIVTIVAIQERSFPVFKRSDEGTGSSMLSGSGVTPSSLDPA